MGARIIDGKHMGAAVRVSLRERIARSGRSVRLDAVLVGDDSAAAIYAQNQAHTCQEAGIEYQLHRLPAGSGYEEIAGRVLLMNTDESVTAMMLHLPLPIGVGTERVQSLIASEKDVEGVNPANIGNVVYGRRSLVPCTALAVLEMIEHTGTTLRGARCVIVGASNIVGKPIAVLLMREEATVISANRFTAGLPHLAREADIVVVAAGVPALVTPEWIKPGAVVIDVGINRVASKDGKQNTVGDVHPDVASVAGWMSPVPGGVGPMTVAMLLRNVAEAALR
jgi:methylenetetrahydrofolate dehydrogenase (NADP+)/methenyltetrahydrofolate cyclohydrolase